MPRGRPETGLSNCTAAEPLGFYAADVESMPSRARLAARESEASLATTTATWPTAQSTGTAAAARAGSAGAAGAQGAPGAPGAGVAAAAADAARPRCTRAPPLRLRSTTTRLAKVAARSAAVEMTARRSARVRAWGFFAFSVLLIRAGRYKLRLRPGSAREGKDFSKTFHELMQGERLLCYTCLGYDGPCFTPHSPGPRATRSKKAGEATVPDEGWARGPHNMLSSQHGAHDATLWSSARV